MTSRENQVVITEDSHDSGFRRRPMARWAEDGSVAKARGGTGKLKGANFTRCLPQKLIEMDLATIMASAPDHKRTRTRDQTQQAKRNKTEGSGGASTENSH
mmetsp:Transcript_28856/g.63197  ORF Transcript_28856/g.63197 Transcript_28856/m.63197 type:complete len:101 (-) Transcript_28856:232-534(-)